MVHNVSFMGGCSGNLKAIPLLIEGWTVKNVEEKLAGAIAKAVGVDAETTSVPLAEDVDILFLGSSVYAGGVDLDPRKAQTLYELLYEVIGRLTGRR